METEEPPRTHSIALRLRRVVHEDVYVTVFVDESITKVNEDGSRGIDWDKFVSRAIATSESGEAEWQLEGTQVEVHPIQQPKPAHRTSVDSKLGRT